LSAEIKQQGIALLWRLKSAALVVNYSKKFYPLLAVLSLTK
jgi:hypothetical protein